jgi:hypothetical protein
MHQIVPIQPLIKKVPKQPIRLLKQTRQLRQKIIQRMLQKKRNLK